MDCSPSITSAQVLSSTRPQFCGVTVNARLLQISTIFTDQRETLAIEVFYYAPGGKKGRTFSYLMST